MKSTAFLGSVWCLLLMPNLVLGKGQTIERVLRELQILPDPYLGKCAWTRKEAIKKTEKIDWNRPRSKSMKGLENNWACLELEKYLKTDSFQLLPRVFDENLQVRPPEAPVSERRIQGTLRYLPMVKLPYRYRISYEKGIWIARVRIFFKRLNAPSRLKEVYSLDDEADRLVQNANFYFNHALSRMDAHKQFALEVVRATTELDADFNLSIRHSTKAEGSAFYLKFINSEVGGENVDTSIAHEVGHMFGLPDEYSYHSLVGKGHKKVSLLRCFPNSLMCTLFGHYENVFMWGDLHLYQLYWIFRRAFAE